MASPSRSSLRQTAQSCQLLTLFGRTLLAERAQQVFVQLEPHRVVRVDQRLGEPLEIAGLDALDGGRQAPAVAAEPGQQLTETVDRRQGAFVKGAQVGEDAGVVPGVAVVVDDRLAVDLAQLPGAGRGEQHGIQGEELLVGGLDLGLASSGSQFAGHQLGVKRSACRGQRPPGDATLAVTRQIVRAEIGEDGFDICRRHPGRLHDRPGVGEALQPQGSDDEKTRFSRVGHGLKLVGPRWSSALVLDYEAAASASRSLVTSSYCSYSSPVSAQSSKAMTPSSVKRFRSKPSAASRRPSFLQFGTILENNICWNMARSGACIVS